MKMGTRVDVGFHPEKLFFELDGKVSFVIKEMRDCSHDPAQPGFNEVRDHFGVLK